MERYFGLPELTQAEEQAMYWQDSSEGSEDDSNDSSNSSIDLKTKSDRKRREVTCLGFWRFLWWLFKFLPSFLMMGPETTLDSVQVGSAP